jgi:nitrite reductase/ring-hydroxylating ferredoxin subunit
MNQVQTENIFQELPGYEEAARQVSRGLHEKVLQGGKWTRTLADLLHGTWLGHPLHALLTDVVIGSWVFGALFDWIGILTGPGFTKKKAEEAADGLLAVGAASAVPTALAGLADYTTLPGRAMTTGATHALLNTAGLALNLLSLANRKSGRRGKGLFLSSFALSLMTISAWLGGELAYKYAVGVNKSSHPKKPQDWLPVLDEGELPEQQPRRVSVEGTDVLLYRYGGTIYAIGAVCGHDGGPLNEGRFDGLCVECPWHQSVFDLRDGRVIHGPSTYAVPGYQARITDGRVEVRLDEKWQIANGK